MSSSIKKCRRSHPRLSLKEISHTKVIVFNVVRCINYRNDDAVKRSKAGRLTLRKAMWNTLKINIRLLS
ncbi:hypothetical protein [Symbiopectobacterium purcellii]|uniref:Transposase n=1 Tax=Symbiopectobacterium purcellii TaxID=2871826 RepID=A0ABX9AJ15_9ENTR|nr:hypothetical protein [Symbiopectobacterium purcellii]QZN94261.1 hypothetical protein K6K13_12865 [Symbiopectobacterium purcellii]